MTRTPKFELQIEKTDDRLLCIGVDSIKEAKSEIVQAPSYCNDMTGKCYLWPNSGAGRSYFNRRDADYYHIDAKTLKIEACGIPIVY